MYLVLIGRGSMEKLVQILANIDQEIYVDLSKFTLKMRW